MPFLFLVLSATNASPATDIPWWDNQWLYRRRIDVYPPDTSETLHDFPITLHLDTLAFPEAGANWHGSDIRFVSENGRELPHYVYYRQPSRIVASVRIAQIGGDNTPATVYMYYGNPNADAASDAAQVWDEKYRLVAIFDTHAYDPRHTSNIGDFMGDAHIDVAGLRTGPDEGWFDVASELLDEMGEAITITLTYKSNNPEGHFTLVSGERKEGTEEWFNFALRAPSVLHTNTVSDGKQLPEVNLQGNVIDGQCAASVMYDVKTGGRLVCLNGEHTLGDMLLSGPLRVDSIRIGRGLRHFDSWQFDGVIQELRLASVARSASWMQLETACMLNKNPYVAIGAATQQNAPESVVESFALHSPVEGTQIKKRNGNVFRWFPLVGANSYTVITARDAALLDDVQQFDAGQNLSMVLKLDKTGAGTRFWTVEAQTASGPIRAAEIRTITVYDWSAPPEEPVVYAIAPTFVTASNVQIELHGYLRDRIDRLIQRYYIDTPESSPAILQVLRDRDRTPRRDPLMPWAGEFAGKYLTGAQLAWRLTRDAELKTVIDRFVVDLIACQQPDGYLGPFPYAERLTGPNWDVWGHYHCILGLLMYYEDTEYAPALEACVRAADLLFEVFGPGGPTLTNDGSGGEMNMSVCHGLLLLYRATGHTRYLELARYIVHDAWNESSAGQYLRYALENKRIVEFPRHRWESLHNWQALYELYLLEGNPEYRRAFEWIWWDALRGDRHNTGGVTAAEGFQDNPYHQAPIETCCTVAWTAYSLDMLHMTGLSRVADELEWSTFNSALGAIPYSGRACAYNVPMDGTRAFGVELPWQSPKAGPDLNCCAVNAGRPLGQMYQWALMQHDHGLAVNYYGPCEMAADLPSGNRITLTQHTDYPIKGRIDIEIETQHEESFSLLLRIPFWSTSTQLTVNGESVEHVVAGNYAEINRIWRTGDSIELTLDMTPHIWSGARECEGKVAVFRGPLSMAFDARYHTIDPHELPVLHWQHLSIEQDEWTGSIPPWFLGVLCDKEGHSFPICDLSSAGQTGNHYRTWFESDSLPPAWFSLRMPLHGEAVSHKKIEFVWEEIYRAETIELLLAQHPDLSDAQSYVLPRETSKMQLNDLDPATYYWTVIAHNDAGMTFASNGPWVLVTGE